MTAYAVLLRAVNVGGRNKVPMAELRRLAGDLGYRDVATYLQSGNLVATADADEDTVCREVREALRGRHGVDVKVMARRGEELVRIVADDVLGEVAHDPKRRLVSFLSRAPDADRVAALDPDEFLPERYEVRGRELYLWCPDGLGRSKLAAAPWERRLGGVSATGRNWSTVLALLDMLQN